MRPVDAPGRPYCQSVVENRTRVSDRTARAPRFPDLVDNPATLRPGSLGCANCFASIRAFRDNIAFKFNNPPEEVTAALVIVYNDGAGTPHEAILAKAPVAKSVLENCGRVSRCDEVSKRTAHRACS